MQNETLSQYPVCSVSFCPRAVFHFVPVLRSKVPDPHASKSPKRKSSKSPCNTPTNLALNACTPPGQFLIVQPICLLRYLKNVDYEDIFPSYSVSRRHFGRSWVSNTKNFH